MDRLGLWIVVAVLSVLSLVTTQAARHAGEAARKAEQAVRLERDNTAILDAIRETNVAGEARAREAAVAVVTYLRCLTLIPAETPRALVRAELDECAAAAGLKPGPKPAPVPEEETTNAPS